MTGLWLAVLMAALATSLWAFGVMYVAELFVVLGLCGLAIAIIGWGEINGR